MMPPPMITTSTRAGRVSSDGTGSTRGAMFLRLRNWLGSKEPAAIMNDRTDEREDYIDIEDEPGAVTALETVDGGQGPARQLDAEEAPLDEEPGKPGFGRGQSVIKIERPEAFEQQAGVNARTGAKTAGIAPPGETAAPIFAAVSVN